jgi:hypothetical protein
MRVPHISQRCGIDECLGRSLEVSATTPVASHTSPQKGEIWDTQLQGYLVHSIHYGEAMKTRRRGNGLQLRELWGPIKRTSTHEYGRYAFRKSGSPGGTR